MAVVGNHLIERLPELGRQHLPGQCASVSLVSGSALFERGQATAHAYLLKIGFVSLLMQIDHHPGLEIGMIGREGMLGAQLALGRTDNPLPALVRGSGLAWRVSAAVLTAELARSAALRQNPHGFIQQRLGQLAGSVACQRFHMIGPRLARWLLMNQHHAEAASLHITHELLVSLLGVRRVGVTTAAGALQ